MSFRRDSAASLLRRAKARPISLLDPVLDQGMLATFAGGGAVGGGLYGGSTGSSSHSLKGGGVAAGALLLVLQEGGEAAGAAAGPSYRPWRRGDEDGAHDDDQEDHSTTGDGCHEVPRPRRAPGVDYLLSLVCEHVVTSMGPLEEFLDGPSSPPTTTPNNVSACGGAHPTVHWMVCPSGAGFPLHDALFLIEKAIIRRLRRECATLGVGGHSASVSGVPISTAGQDNFSLVDGLSLLWRHHLLKSEASAAAAALSSTSASTSRFSALPSMSPMDAQRVLRRMILACAARIVVHHPRDAGELISAIVAARCASPPSPTDQRPSGNEDKSISTAIPMSCGPPTQSNACLPSTDPSTSLLIIESFGYCESYLTVLEKQVGVTLPLAWAIDHFRTKEPGAAVIVLDAAPSAADAARPPFPSPHGISHASSSVSSSLIGSDGHLRRVQTTAFLSSLLDQREVAMSAACAGKIIQLAADRFASAFSSSSSNPNQTIKEEATATAISPHGSTRVKVEKESHRTQLAQTATAPHPSTTTTRGRPSSSEAFGHRSVQLKDDVIATLLNLPLDASAMSEDMQTATAASSTTAIRFRQCANRLLVSLHHILLIQTAVAPHNAPPSQYAPPHERGGDGTGASSSYVHTYTCTLCSASAGANITSTSNAFSRVDGHQNTARGEGGFAAVAKVSAVFFGSTSEPGLYSLTYQ